MGKRGPKPRSADQKKSQTIALRVSPDLRDQLHAAAEASGRPISRELLERVARTFRDDVAVRDAFGNEKNFMLMRMAAIPLVQNKNWLEDPEQFDATLRAINTLFEQIRPDGPREARNRAIDILAERSIDTADLFAQAMWQMVKDADPSTPRSERSDFEHLSINIKCALGAEITGRADPDAQRRAQARAFLRRFAPREAIDAMDDEHLFRKVDQLHAEEMQQHQDWEEDAAEPLDMPKEPSNGQGS